MRKCIKYFFTVLFFISFLGCKKYPEGGLESRGPKTILKNKGHWALEKYEVNGTDSTDFISTSGDSRFKEVTFYKTSKYSGGDLYVQHQNGFEYQIYFLDDNTSIKMFSVTHDGESSHCFPASSSWSGCFRQLFTPEGNTTIWKIIKLTKKEFILSYNGINSYLISFKCR